MKIMILNQVIALLLMCSMAESIRTERDVCDQTRTEFEACSHQAYTDYKEAFQAGDDGRPDWMARKACNYMTAAVETCGNKLIGKCNSEEEVTANKDHQLTGILIQLQSSVKEWDNDKCPAVKSHIDRLKGEEVAEVEAAQQNASESESAPNDADFTEAVNGTTLFPICFFLLILSFTTLLW